MKCGGNSLLEPSSSSSIPRGKHFLHRSNALRMATTNVTPKTNGHKYLQSSSSHNCRNSRAIGESII
jgi:hypothetical protein